MVSPSALETPGCEFAPVGLRRATERASILALALLLSQLRDQDAKFWAAIE